MEALEELREEIANTEPGAEREELERTLDWCEGFVYAVQEGFADFELDEENEDVTFFPEAECYFPPELIEA